MNADLINRYNQKVGKEDHTIFLGDFSFGSLHGIYEILSQLNGTKELIRGNHDHHTNKKYTEAGFIEVSHRKVLEHDGVILWMSHFPSYDKRRQTCNDFTYGIHGHSHSSPDNRFSMSDGKVFMDVGVDGNSMNPYSIEEVIQLCKSYDNQQKPNLV